MFITDDKGQNYGVQTYDNPDGSFDLRIKYESQDAGETVSSMRQKGDMVLEYICIRNDNDPDNSRSRTFLSRSSGTAIDFRDMGLGTKLLKLYIDCARNRGLKRLYCSIMERHILNKPYLVDWYKKYGFKECEPYPHHVPGAKICLCLELSHNQVEIND